MTAASPYVRFLIASDIHAGYGESKRFINNDSFISFEEVLKNGVENKVDFILLGGDLFHENNPSRETQLKITRLLRKYCLNNNEVGIEFLSDPSINFHHSNFSTVNYEDENLNVGMPIFTIHGNHDDLSGKGLTALDVFHESGLINLFGKFNNIEKFEVAPILLRKGNTKLAIYGISSQRDDRLSRAFMNENIKFLRPEAEPETWFSILVLHQNRPRRSSMRTTGGYLPISYIPSFFDFVLWGHEHESLIEPQYFGTGDNKKIENGFFIIQPGSTVATSMCREEAVQKHCSLITVRNKKFQSKAIKLETTRQVIIEDIHLDDSVPMHKFVRSTVRSKNMQDEEIISKRLEEILKEATFQRGPCQPLQPLIRLKVFYSGNWLNIPPINGRRFGLRYAEQVANASEMLSVRTIKPEKLKDLNDTINSVLGDQIDEIHSVDKMVEKYFGECNFNDKMSVLTEVSLIRSIQEYSNVDTGFTFADRSLTESIKNQINAFSGKLHETTEDLSDINLIDENNLLKRVEGFIYEIKKFHKGDQPSTFDNETTYETENSAAASTFGSGDKNYFQMEKESVGRRTRRFNCEIDDEAPEFDFSPNSHRTSTQNIPKHNANYFFTKNTQPTTSRNLSSISSQFHASDILSSANLPIKQKSKTLLNNDDWDEDIYE